MTVGQLASLSITPNPANLNAAGQQQFVALAQDISGNTVPIAVSWSVVAGGGSIDGAGLLTAGAAPGTFTNTVRAAIGSLVATATVIVGSGSLASIVVTPSPSSVTIGGVQQFAAVGLDVAGNQVAITPTWSVVASGGAISATGLFTAGAVTGTFTNTVRASSNGVSGFATVIVPSGAGGALATISVTPNPVFMTGGTAQQFVAVGKDASGNVFVITPVWSVVNGGGVIDASGLFTAGAARAHSRNTVKATSGAISGTATVTVTAARRVLSRPSP